MTKDLATSNYWDESWMGTKLPRTMHPHRNPIDRKFQKFLKAHLPVGGKFLEIGCGASSWMPFFGIDMKCQLSGVDYSPNGLELTRKNLELFGLKADLHLGNFTELSLPEDYYDVVYSGGVIEHYQDPTPLFQKAAKILRPGGFKLTVIPNHWGVFGTMLKTLDPAVYKVHMPFGASDMDRFQVAAGLEPVVPAIPFGVFYSGMLNWQGRTTKWPTVINRGIAYALQTLDRVVGWSALPFGSLFESHRLSPYFISIYRKKR